MIPEYIWRYNVIVNQVSCNLEGVVDWDEADIAPFGLNLQSHQWDNQEHSSSEDSGTVVISRLHEPSHGHTRACSG